MSHGGGRKGWGWGGGRRGGVRGGEGGRGGILHESWSRCRTGGVHFVTAQLHYWMWYSRSSWRSGGEFFSPAKTITVSLHEKMKKTITSHDMPDGRTEAQQRTSCTSSRDRASSFRTNWIGPDSSISTRSILRGTISPLPTTGGASRCT